MRPASPPPSLGDLVRLAEEHARAQVDREDPMPYCWGVRADGGVTMVALAFGGFDQIRPAIAEIARRERWSMAVFAAETWALSPGQAAPEDLRRGQRGGREAFDYEKVPGRRETVLIVAEDLLGGRREARIDLAR